MPSKPRTRLLTAFLSASLLALVAIPGAGAAVATSSDAAGDAYEKSIAKAKEKRTAKLKNCNKKPSKAKRAACKKAANKAFQTAKDAAQEKRDAAHDPGPSGGPPSSPGGDPKECIDNGGDPRECKEGAGGGKGEK